MSLVPTLKLSLEMTNTLSQIERNGLRINLDTLADIRKQYEEEMQELEDRLMQLARDAMGDTPINLSSPDDRSVLLYSRKVRDKKEWARTFNLGHEMRGSTMKRAVHGRYEKTAPPVRQYVYASPVAALASFTCLLGK